MLFFYDESGDFKPSGKRDRHKCAVVCGIVVPDLLVDRVRSDYATFVSSLRSEETIRGEPKGHLLSDNNRFLFCEILNGYPPVLLTPKIVDLAMEAAEGERVRATVFRALENAAEAFIYDGPRRSMRLLSRQWRNLSDCQALRLLTLASCFWESLQHSVLFHSNAKYDACWDSLAFYVDAVRLDSGARENALFRTLIMAWLAAWSSDRPLITIGEIHTPEHPLVRRFRRADGKYDIGSMLRGNVKFSDSAHSWGLQVADIASSIIYQAAHDLQNHGGRLGLFRKLMANCPYPLADAPILLGFEGAKADPQLQKYQLIANVMLHRRRLLEPDLFETR